MLVIRQVHFTTGVTVSQDQKELERQFCHAHRPPATMQEHMRKGERMLRGVESAESKRKKNLRRDAFPPLPATVAFLYFSHRRNKSNPKITD